MDAYFSFSSDNDPREVNFGAGWLTGFNDPSSPEMSEISLVQGDDVDVPFPPAIFLGVSWRVTTVRRGASIRTFCFGIYTFGISSKNVIEDTVIMN